MLKAKILTTYLVLLLIAARASPQTELDIDYGRDSLRYADIDGTRLAYIEKGSGAPVILVHGALSDYRYWAPQIEAGADRQRMIAYSRRDFYPNAPNPVPDLQTPNRDVLDLISFIEGLDAGPVHLVGHSAGGHVALLVAVRRPDLVRSLVLEEGGFVADDPRSAEAIAEIEPVIARSLALQAVGDSEGAVAHFLDYVSGDGYTAALPRNARRILVDNAHTLGLRPNADLTCEQVATVDVPVLFLVGEQSPIYLNKLFGGVQKCLRAESTIEIAGASHGMHYEQPTAFNEALFEFVTRR